MTASSKSHAPTDAHLPLSSANDVVAGPFPKPVTLPASATDAEPAGSERLVLYRVLWNGDRAARNTLRAVKSPGGVELRL